MITPDVIVIENCEFSRRKTSECVSLTVTEGVDGLLGVVTSETPYVPAVHAVVGADVLEVLDAGMERC